MTDGKTENRQAHDLLDHSGIGKRLRYFRVISGKTQVQAANHLGVSFQQIQKYENGKNRISAPDINALCQLYQIPIEEIVSQKTEIAPSDAPMRNVELFRYFNGLSKDAQRAVMALLRVMSESK